MGISEKSRKMFRSCTSNDDGPSVNNISRGLGYSGVIVCSRWTNDCASSVPIAFFDVSETGFDVMIKWFFMIPVGSCRVSHFFLEFQMSQPLN
jgi:hypothetical protein